MSMLPLHPHLQSQSDCTSTVHVSQYVSSTAYDLKETGQTIHQKGLYFSGIFDGLKSSLDFAATLGVPLKAIPMIVFKDDNCISKGCIHEAIVDNKGYCPAHLW